MYRSATIFFGDIVNFTNLSALSTASEIIDFLNRLYKIFDSVIDNYDVFKANHFINHFGQQKFIEGDKNT
jgi:class 3 adenylate cyclase